MPVTLTPTQAAFNAPGDGKFNRPFAVQLDFFRQKLNLPTERYDDILRDAHDRAFMVAGAMKADLLTDLRDAVDRAIAEGKSIGWFRKNFDDIVRRHGWEGWTGSDTRDGRDWRTRLIYRTNLATSYAAGRYKQLNDPDLIKRRPYWKYVHNDSVQHPRPLHVQWSGTVLRHDDPWWQDHYPPNGYGCHCRVTAVRASQYIGAKAPDDGTYEHVDRYGEIHTLPKGVDFGWDYAPGASVQGQLRQIVRNKAKTLPPPIAKDFKKEIAEQGRYWQSGTEQAKWHDASFRDAPVWLKGAIKKHDPQFKGLINNPRKGAFHRAGKINMGRAADPANYNRQGTWRHEYGHFIDFKKGSIVRYRSAEPDFADLIKEETEEIKKASGFGRRSKKNDQFLTERAKRYDELFKAVRDRSKVERTNYLNDKAGRVGLSLDAVKGFFGKETIWTIEGIGRDARIAKLLQAVEDRDAANFMDAIYKEEGVDELAGLKAGKQTYERGLTGKFSDLVGSASKNRLLGHGPHGFGGHGNAYLKGKGNPETEVFANLTALLGSGSEFWDKVTRRFYPKLSQRFEEIMNE